MAAFAPKSLKQPLNDRSARNWLTSSPKVTVPGGQNLSFWDQSLRTRSHYFSIELTLRFCYVRRVYGLGGARSTVRGDDIFKSFDLRWQQWILTMWRSTTTPFQKRALLKEWKVVFFTFAISTTGRKACLSVRLIIHHTLRNLNICRTPLCWFV